MSRLIGPDDITIKHRIGEDASGVAINVQYVVSGYLEQRSGINRSDLGHASSNSITAVFEPDGYKDTWDVVRGDRLVCRASSVEVLSVFEAWNPRSGALHHIEADCS